MLNQHSNDGPETPCEWKHQCARICEPATEQTLYMHGFNRIKTQWGWCYLTDAQRPSSEGPQKDDL